MNLKKQFANVFLLIAVVCGACSIASAQAIPLPPLIPCDVWVVDPDDTVFYLRRCETEGADCGIWGIGRCGTTYDDAFFPIGCECSY